MLHARQSKRVYMKNKSQDIEMQSLTILAPNCYRTERCVRRTCSWLWQIPGQCVSDANVSANTDWVMSFSSTLVTRHVWAGRAVTTESLKNEKLALQVRLFVKWHCVDSRHDKYYLCDVLTTNAFTQAEQEDMRTSMDRTLILPRFKLVCRL